MSCYDCDNYLSPYCWSWDTNGVQEDQRAEKMITPNNNDLIKNARAADSTNNSGGTGNSGSTDDSVDSDHAGQ